MCVCVWGLLPNACFDLEQGTSGGSSLNRSPWGWQGGPSGGRDAVGSRPSLGPSAAGLGGENRLAAERKALGALQGQVR